MDIDPYKMLGVPKNFTPDQLRSSYKKLALVMHPDKQGGNDYMFKTLTTCYKLLVRQYNLRIQDKQFHELKKDFTAHQTQPSYVPVQDPKKSFNINKFNEIFEQNKIPDAVRDTGYNEFLRESTDSNQPKLKGKLSNEAFNAQFEKHTKAEPSKHLIKYQEPEPMFAGKKIQFTELGQDKVDDFSADNLSKKNLNYMDLKLAHTTNRIVDPRTVDKRKTYNTIGDVEADRANISYQMSEKDLKEYHMQKQLEETREKQRQMTQQKLDQLTQEHFDVVNRLMLGRRK